MSSSSDSPAQPVRHRLVEHLALRRKQHHLLCPGVRSGQIDLHRLKDRLRLEHHAFAAAERPVVHRLVAVVRPVPQIVDANVEQAGVLAPA